MSNERTYTSNVTLNSWDILNDTINNDESDTFMVAVSKPMEMKK